MARTLKTTGTLCLVVGLTSIALGQQQPKQPKGIFGFGSALFEPSIQKELKLSDEQTGKLKDSLVKVMAKYKDDFDKFQKTPPSPQEAEKTSKAFNDDCWKAISGVLDAKQIKRFKQILWQSIGIQSVRDPELQKELKLSNEQKKKIADIFEDIDKKGQDLAAKRQLSKEKIDALVKETEEKVNGVLSEEQKKNLKELKGPPFAFSQSAPPPKEKR